MKPSRKFFATLDSIEVSLRTAEEQARNLISGISDTQANWRPNDGNSWSICQCLEHLGKMNVVLAAALLEGVSRSPKELKRPTIKIEPGFVGRWFVRTMDAPPMRKFKTAFELLPGPGGDPSGLLQSFVRSHEPLREILERGASIDLNRLRFKNPFLGILPFTVGTGLLVINAHDRRHLWQANEVRKRTDFPRN